MGKLSSDEFIIGFKKNLLNNSVSIALLAFISLILLQGCSKEKQSQKTLVGTSSSLSNHSLASKPVPKIFSPKLLWKTYLGYGKIQLLNQNKLLSYCYLESTNYSPRNLMVIALDLENGKRLYYKKDNLTANIKPFVKDKVLYYSNMNGFHGYDLLKGKEICSLNRGVYRVISKTGKKKNTVFLMKSTSINRIDFDKLVSFDLKRNKVNWELPYHLQRIFLTKKHLYYISKNNRLVVLDKKKGKTIKKEFHKLNRLKGQKRILHIANEILYLAIDNKFIAINLANKELLWKLILSSNIVKSFSPHKRILIIKCDDSFYCISKKRGRIIWKKNHSGTIKKIIAKKLIILMKANKMLAIDINNGKTLWEVNHLKPNIYPVYLDKEFFYFNAIDNGKFIIKKVNPLSKPLETTYRTKDNGYDFYPERKLNIKKIGSLLFLGSSAALFYEEDHEPIISLKAFDSTKGREIWNYNAFKASYFNKPILLNGSIVVGNDKGELLAFQPWSGKVIWKFKVPKSLEHQKGNSLFKLIAKNRSIMYVYFGGHVLALDTNNLSEISKEKEQGGA